MRLFKTQTHDEKANDECLRSPCRAPCAQAGQHIPLHSVGCATDTVVARYAEPAMRP